MTPPPVGRPSTTARRTTPTLNLRLVAAAVLVAVAACSRQPATTAPSPARSVGGSELAIYRTIAESVYVRTTQRAVGIVTSPLDTACTTSVCKPLTTRWGLDPLWWAKADTSDALTARDNLLANTSRRMSLDAVSEGQPMLQSIAPDSVAILAAQPDTAHWKAFKERHGAPSGILWFSPIGFDASRQSAIVFADWQCGPVCGHTVAIALSVTDAGAWRIDNMLLLSSRSPNGSLGSH